MRALMLSLTLVAVVFLTGSRPAAMPITPSPLSQPSSSPASIEVRKVACALPASAGRAVQGCGDCENRCESQIRACKSGSIKSCYLAAACLCRCNLDAGGCGSSTTALRQCVEQNEKLARELDE